MLKFHMKTLCKFVSFFLQCEGTPENSKCISWSCSVNAKLEAVSQKKDIGNCVQKFNFVILCSQEVSGVGFLKFLRWDIAQEAYSKDNSVTFLAHVHTDVPCLGNSISYLLNKDIV